MWRKVGEGENGAGKSWYQCSTNRAGFKKHGGGRSYAVATAHGSWGSSLAGGCFLLAKRGVEMVRGGQGSHTAPNLPTHTPARWLLAAPC